ncbi:MAG: AMP-dependent synthetase [Flavobacteriales bacterium]|nr:MAG: AMP-dependent synthetase [Flavobacteriales bacterium]
MDNKYYDFPFYKWEKEKANDPFLRQPFGDNWEEYTWGEVGVMARKMATAISSYNLTPKSNIGLISKNCREWIIADLAVMMAGHISVPFFPTLQSFELEKLIDFGEVKLLFAGKLENWDEQSKGVKNIPVISFPHYENHSVINNSDKWEDLLKNNEPQKEDYYPELDDIWTIVFTSGTTGDPKGVVLDYRTIFLTKIIVESDVNPLGMDRNGNNSFFSYLPLNHIFERVVLEFQCMRYGGTMSFVESLESFPKNLADVQPTTFAGVPRIYNKFKDKILEKMPQKRLNFLLSVPIISSLIKKKVRKSLGWSNANAIVSGAAFLPQDLIEWYGRLGINILNGYGMTENCCVCSYLDTTTADGKGSVGKPWDQVEIKIGENGEILNKSPYLLKEYYKNPDYTNEVLVDGWFNTGDKGHLDDNGYLHITGRVKDIFKTSKGKYIEPHLIEEKFEKSNLFQQLCIVGLGLAQPILLAVPNEQALNDKEKTKESLKKILLDFNSTADGYKKVKKIILLSEDWKPENGLTTPTLKIKRAKIDEAFSSKYQNWYNATEEVIWGYII